MKKRIAIAIDTLTGGGAEKVVLTLADEFYRLGHDVHILVMNDERLHYIPKNINIHVCFSTPIKYTIGFFNIKKSVDILRGKINELENKFGKFDIFYSNLDVTNYLMILTKVSPLYCIVHAPIEEALKRQKRLGPLAYLKMAKMIKALNNQNIICVSQGMADEIIMSDRVKPKFITTIYNPFDENKIRDLSNQECLSIPDQDYIIHVGRFAKSKRHDLLFRAIKEIDSNIPLVLLCKNTKKALKSIKKYGVEDRVILPGFQQNPFPWIKHAKALVLCSDYEGLGNVLIEAIACNTPVVSTDCPYGPREILTGNLAKYLVPMNNVQMLSKVIDKALIDEVNLDISDILKKTETSVIAKKYLDLIDNR